MASQGYKGMKMRQVWIDEDGTVRTFDYAALRQHAFEVCVAKRKASYLPMDEHAHLSAPLVEEGVTVDG